MELKSVGKDKRNLPVFIKAFIFLLVITSIGAVILFARTKPSLTTTTVSSTVTSTPTTVPTLTLTPTAWPTVTSTSTPNIEVKPPPVTSTAATLTQPATTPLYTYEIINTFPHDPNAFTQGLIWIDGILYEGTGRYKQSTLRRVALDTGQVLQMKPLPPELFGEGITLFDDKIVQLTWQNGLGFVYNPKTFELIGQFTYPTEGWGITHDGQQLIMSDGSATLYFWDPDTFTETGHVDVFDENGPVVRLNELEYINGEIYANIWQTDRIARIDPKTGRVTGWILLTDLLSPEELTNPSDMANGVAVLNGIAYDADNDRLFVTGKLWPKLFEIKVVPLDN